MTREWPHKVPDRDALTFAREGGLSCSIPCRAGDRIGIEIASVRLPSE